MSVSMQVRDYLRNLPKDQSFTSRDIANYLGLPKPAGAITGFLAKTKDQGGIEFIEADKATGSYVYRVTDKISKTSARDKSGPGSKLGRKLNRPSKKPHPMTGEIMVPVKITERILPDSIKKIADHLVDIAAVLSHMQPDLSQVSTKDLLSELLKRNTTE